MVDRLRDNEDRKLESLFRSITVPDDGFSVGVMRRVNRRLWVRRLTLPVAFVLGGAIAFNPLSQLFLTLGKLLSFLPVGVSGFSLHGVPQISTIALGGLLALAFVIITRMLEE